MESELPNDDIAEIDSLLEALGRAVEGGDASALEALFEEDALAVFSGGRGAVRGADAVMATWRRHLSQWESPAIQRRNTVVRIRGDVAWAHFLWDGEGRSGGARYRLEGERWTAVLVWSNGRWRFAQTHTSMPTTDWDVYRV